MIHPQKLGFFPQSEGIRLFAIEWDFSWKIEQFLKATGSKLQDQSKSI